MAWLGLAWLGRLRGNDFAMDGIALDRMLHPNINIPVTGRSRFARDIFHPCPWNHPPTAVPGRGLNFDGLNPRSATECRPIIDMRSSFPAGDWFRDKPGCSRTDYIRFRRSDVVMISLAMSRSSRQDDAYQHTVVQPIDADEMPSYDWPAPISCTSRYVSPGTVIVKG